MKNERQMTLKERFQWARENTKINIDNLEKELYSFSFNHPFYIGIVECSDDEERHLLLDDLNIPRG